MFYRNARSLSLSLLLDLFLNVLCIFSFVIYTLVAPSKFYIFFILCYWSQINSKNVIFALALCNIPNIFLFYFRLYIVAICMCQISLQMWGHYRSTFTQFSWAKLFIRVFMFYVWKAVHKKNEQTVISCHTSYIVFSIQCLIKVPYSYTHTLSVTFPRIKKFRYRPYAK